MYFFNVHRESLSRIVLAMINAVSNSSWLKPFLEPLRPVFREVLLLSAFVNLVALAVPVFTLQVYDRVVTHAGVSTLVGFVIGMIIVVIFDYILRQSRSRIMQTVALRIDVLVGKYLFDKQMSLPLNVLESNPASYWQSLFRDVDMVRNTLSGASALLICDLPFVLMFLVLIVIIASPIAWILFIIIPLFLFVAWRSAGAMAAANQQERETTLSRDDLIAEIIAGRTTIKALSLDKAMRPMWEQKHAENIENSIIRGAKADFYSSFGGSLTMLTTIGMTSAGAVAIINQELTMGALIATNMLIGRLLGPLNQLVGQWRTYNSFFQSLDRLGTIFNIPSERQQSDISLARPEGEITIENVTFSYQENLAPAINQVSHVIKSRGVHAVVGRNGSGKTTLMKLIQGLYKPASGRVLIDGADIEQFSRLELTQWIGYVPQDCVLFAGTIRENILHRDPDASDGAIITAATQAGVHHFIIDLPDGYSTQIGEAGSRLSGGQRQRISIARALLGDPPVLLLDEPSSSLDRQAEQELKKTLVEISTNRTVLIITHSPILLAACDDLVALDKGKVALAGPANEILPKLFGHAPKKAGTPPQNAGTSAASAPPPTSQGQGQAQALTARPVAAPVVQDSQESVLALTPAMKVPVAETGEKTQKSVSPTPAVRPAQQFEAPEAKQPASPQPTEKHALVARARPRNVQKPVKEQKPEKVQKNVTAPAAIPPQTDLTNKPPVPRLKAPGEQPDTKTVIEPTQPAPKPPQPPVKQPSPEVFKTQDPPAQVPKIQMPQGQPSSSQPPQAQQIPVSAPSIPPVDVNAPQRHTPPAEPEIDISDPYTDLIEQSSPAKQEKGTN